MDSTFIEQLKARLLKEKERLEKGLTSFATKDTKMRGDWDTVFPAAASADAHLSHAALDEQADAREEFETLLAQEQSLESRLLEVNRALERIPLNTFGQCRTCGEAISPERLEANPAAEYDIQHQPKE